MRVSTLLSPENSDLFEKSSFGRITVDSDFSEEDAIAIRDHQGVGLVQCKQELNDSVYRLLNDIVYSERPDIWFRAYGYYAGNCDFQFLENLPDVQNLSLGRISESTNIEAISELNRIDSLSIEINDLTCFEFLNSHSSTIRYLNLGKTKSKKPSLSVLERFNSLETLSIRGHRKSLETITQLPELNNLSLCGIKVESLSFLSEIPKLNECSLDLITCEDFYTMGALDIKYLAVSEIRKMEDLGFLECLQKLQFLKLSYLKNVTHFPKLSSSDCIRRIIISDMKSLRDVSELFYCSALEELALIGGLTNLKAEDFQPLAAMKNLKYATIGTGRVKENELVNRILCDANISKYEHRNFEYL